MKNWKFIGLGKKLNQIDQNVTVEMIKRFQIDEDYDDGFPCSHMCKINLTDGRKTKKCIEGIEIYILIQAIAKEKIVFKEKKKSSFALQNLKHFDDYKDLPYTEFRRNKSRAPLPDELLSSLFNNTLIEQSSLPL